MNSSTTMQSHAGNYLNERRRLGFGLRSPGNSIQSFARYFDDLGSQGAPTIEVMADWARLDKGKQQQPGNLGSAIEKSTLLCPLFTTV